MQHNQMQHNNVIALPSPQPSNLLNNFTDEHSGVRWSVINENSPQRMTMALLNGLRDEQREAARLIDQGEDIHYHIFTSDIPGVFNLGGDLGSFINAAKRNDRQSLLDYGKLAITVICEFYLGYKKDITTISVINGAAFGGGFEAALAANVVIAEEQAIFQFPETRFGLFPGMGAYHLLEKRVPSRVAEEIIYSGRQYTANEMKALGVIDRVCETGTGDSAAADYIREHKRQHAGITAMRNAIRPYTQLDYSAMEAVVEKWTDLVLALPEKQLRVMQTLAAQRI